jgi:DNA-binding transcriptional LysR family regulator
MTPKQLRHLLAIRDAGSLARAAQTLNISEPALSKTLKDLEQELSVKLMDRTPRGMVPTVFGQSLIAHAQAIEGTFRRALEDIAELKGSRKGQVALGFSPTFGADIVADTILRLCSERPEIRVITREGIFHDLEPQVLRGELDLAAVTLREQQSPTSDIAQVLLKRDPTIVVARSKHPLARKRTVSLRELTAFPWLMAGRGDSVRARLEHCFESRGLLAPQPTIEFDSVQLAKSLMRAHDFLAFVPSMFVHNDIAAGRLKKIPCSELAWDRPIGIIHHRHISMSPVARALVKQLADAVGASSL